MARILVLEDDPLQLRLLQELLSGERGHEVDPVTTLEGAEESYAREVPDAVLSDYHLGPLTAEPFLARLQADGIPLLVLTGADDPAVPEGVEVRQKPTDVDLLLEHIDHLLGQVVEGDGHACPVVREEAEPIHLALYVTGSSQRSRAARRNLDELLAGWEGTKVELEVIDVEEDPGAWRAEDRVSFTPTLVRRAPAPRAWAIGDLSDPEAVRALLLR